MTIERLLVWPLLAIGYGSVFAAFAHWLTDTWSGAASLGLLFSLVFVAPSVVGYAGRLWCKNLLQGTRRWEAAVCAAFPVSILLLAGCVAMVGRIQW